MVREAWCGVKRAAYWVHNIGYCTLITNKGIHMLTAAVLFPTGIDSSARSYLNLPCHRVGVRINC